MCNGPLDTTGPAPNSIADRVRLWNAVQGPIMVRTLFLGAYLICKLCDNSINWLDTPCPFDREPVVTHYKYGGVRYGFIFDNGYGASVIRHRVSVGHEYGLWELAVLQNDGKGHYINTVDTPITDDVEGNLEISKVNDLLSQIEQLPTTGEGA